MRTTALGPDGPPIGIVGLGCMGMTFGYDMDAPRDERELVGVIRAAIDAGSTLIDTADSYGPHTNEQLVGRALQDGYRERAVLATKVGYVPRGGGRNVGPVDIDATPEHIRAAIDSSLRRLGTDHVDLYQLHRVDPAVPIEDSWEALAELVVAGKARQVGLSQVTLDELERAHAIHPVASVQSELSLWTREQLDRVVPFCETNDITFIAYSPMGNGFLTGTFSSREELPANDMRRLLPGFSDEDLDRHAGIVDELRRIAARVGASPAQVALAWVIAQGQHVVPIPGTKTPRYLAENLAAAHLLLDGEDLAALRAAVGRAG